MIPTAMSNQVTSTSMMVAPVIRKDRSATEEFSRRYTTIYEMDRGDSMSMDMAAISSGAHLNALLASPLGDVRQTSYTSEMSGSALAPAKSEPSDELADLFNLTIDDILDQSLTSPTSVVYSDFEEEQQRFQEFVFLQNYPFAEDTVGTVLTHNKKHMESPSSSSYPSPSESAINSPRTPNLDWTRSPSPSPSLASPTMEAQAKFEPYPSVTSPSTLRSASASPSCSSTVGPVKSCPRSPSRKSTTTETTTATTTAPSSPPKERCSHAHVTPRRRHRVVPVTALVMEPGMKMVRNKDGSISVFNPTTEEVSYRCSLCPAERFGRIHDYKRHQQSKHQEVVWPCEFCHRPFVRRDALLRHYAVKAGRDDNVHPTEDQADLLAEAKARAKLIG